jgi:hypothetical protein
VPRPARRRTVARLLAAAAALALGGCGAPPRPLPTAPPETASGGAAAGVSASAYPSGAPTPGAQFPSPGLPAPGFPSLPTVPVAVPPSAAPTSPSPRPPAAPRCHRGPTPQQVIAAISGEPGIPADQPLRVTAGPYCAGAWQFAVVGIAGRDDVEPLLVVTTGTPAGLTLVEAGTEVCSAHVRAEAPPGIRVLACGF